MFRSVIICLDRALSGRLALALESTGHVTVTRTLDAYPSTADLLRTLRVSGTEILFLSFEDVVHAREIAKVLEAELTHIQVVAVHREASPEAFRETMRLGIRESLCEPFEERATIESLSHLKELLDRRPAKYDLKSQLFCFLPSKAGVGTSTIALNVSASLARRPDTSTLLADFDLNSGMIRFMLQLKNEFSVIDAVERAAEMDENLWPQLVTRINGLDVLHAGSINPHYHVEPNRLHELVGFLRHNYKVVCADLSGNLERYSLELMKESKSILLVCTPEMPSLHVAREKLAFLKEIDVKDRVSVILNRVDKKPLISKQQVEELLAVPVVQVFANDYSGVNHALTTGTVMPPNSKMGKQFDQFSASLVEAKIDKHEPKRKFLEFLSVPSQPTA
jgi:pilus assembly protein CpaE